jgi:pimeloyl-ACP methyl ester carboxylesterase
MLARAAQPEVFAGLTGYPPRSAVSEELLPSLLRGIASTDLPEPDAIARITLPVLILAWATDPVHPVETAQRLAELLPSAELRVADSVEDMAHWGSAAADFLQ